jgi:hypothetical protein
LSPPPPTFVPLDGNFDCFAADPTGDDCRSRHPALIALDRIIEAARTLLVPEDGYTSDLPSRIPPDNAACFVSSNIVPFH